MGRFGRFCGLFLACLAFSSTCWASLYPTKYDAAIGDAVHTWWGDLPVWRLFKAQLIAESALNPDARSPVGAEGLGQVMPDTWTQIIRALGYPKTVSRRDAKYAIEGAAWYQMKQRTAWRPQGRTPFQRNDWGLASYNGGLGNMIKAQKLCMDAVLWPDAAPCLVQVTGEHSKETINYVVRINRLWQELEQ